MDLSNVNTARQFFEDKIFNEGYAKGYAKVYAEGKAKGRLEMAVRFVERFGLDTVAEVSGFSREELLSGKLSK